MTPETHAKETITTFIRAWMDKRGITNYSLRATPAPTYGADGRPDMMLIINGIIVEIEAKAGDNKPTPAQAVWLTDTANAGGYAFVVWGDSLDDLYTFETYLEMIVRKQAVVHLKLKRAKRVGAYVSDDESIVHSVTKRVNRRAERDKRAAERKLRLKEMGCEQNSF